jgi:nicotinate-nucleotide pyrophosphorylase (carboxylating)
MQPAAHDPIALALAEDLGAGDLTAQFFVEQRPGTARLFAKESAVAAEDFEVAKRLKTLQAETQI